MLRVWGAALALALVPMCVTAADIARAEWRFLYHDGFDYVAVNSIEKKSDSRVIFNLKQASTIEGRAMGYDKLVGSIVRGFEYECGATTATVLLVVAWDIGGHLLDERTLAANEREQKLVASDPDLKLATRYVCGDKTVKLVHYSGPPRGDPRDDKVLSCLLNGSSERIAVTLNEPAETLLGNPARYSPTTIKGWTVGEEGDFAVVIDRVSGALTITNYKTEWITRGQCEALPPTKF